MTTDRLIRDANALNPYACLAMGYYLQHGKEFDPDVRMAVVWYNRAANAGCARAHWELASMYRDGDKISRDFARYLDHLRQAARLGNLEAQVALAFEYRDGLLLKQDHHESIHWFRAAAEAGHSRAKFMVGYYYAHGIGVPKSEAEAEAWFSMASISGDGDLFLEIGMEYEFAMNGIERNEAEAIRWYSYGADMGHEKCCISLEAVTHPEDGHPMDSYHERLGRLSTAKTQKEINMRDDALAMAEEFFDAGEEKYAFTYYERAAGLGSSEAMFIIAMMYHQGIYVVRNDKKALSILKRASSAGSADAQFFLGRMYDGNGLPKDEEKAIDYYTKAAANGFLAAYYYLGKYVDRPEQYVHKT